MKKRKHKETMKIEVVFPSMHPTVADAKMNEHEIKSTSGVESSFAVKHSF